MKYGTIQSRWIGMTKHGRMNPDFWLKVLEEAAARKIDTANDDAMRVLIRELDK